MKLNLSLVSENAIGELIELEEIIKECNIGGVITKKNYEEPKDGKMASGELMNLLTMTISNSIIPAAVSTFFAILTNFLQNKKSEVELSFECPDGKKFSQKLKVSSDKERDQVIKEFERKYKEECNQPIILDK